MKQGVLPYGVEVVEEADAVTARSGLPLVVEAMRALGVSRAIQQQVRTASGRAGATQWR